VPDTTDVYVTPVAAVALPRMKGNVVIEGSETACPDELNVWPATGTHAWLALENPSTVARNPWTVNVLVPVFVIENDPKTSTNALVTVTTEVMFSVSPGVACVRSADSEAV